MIMKPSIVQRWGSMQPSKTLLAWSCVGSIAATIVVGFMWGGWVTGSSARAMAADAAAEARAELAAAVCVERFQSAGDASAQLAALKELQRYSRGSFVQKGGWATMPDRPETTDRTARLCAERLALSEEAAASAAALR
jgi:hypothetical protein